MLFSISILLLLALTAADFALGNGMSRSQRKALLVVWWLVFLVVLCSVPNFGSTPVYDNEALENVYPF